MFHKRVNIRDLVIVINDITDHYITSNLYNNLLINNASELASDKLQLTNTCQYILRKEREQNIKWLLSIALNS